MESDSGRVPRAVSFSCVARHFGLQCLCDSGIVAGIRGGTNLAGRLEIPARSLIRPRCMDCQEKCVMWDRHCSWLCGPNPARQTRQMSNSRLSQDSDSQRGGFAYVAFPACFSPQEQVGGRSLIKFSSVEAVLREVDLWNLLTFSRLHEVTSRLT
jgi:hypothetical protein